MNKPDFFIVGAPKCGTTALYNYLKQHPEIFMAPAKDINFFSADIVRDRPDRCAWTLAEYLNQFAAAEGHQKIGDASVHCLASPGAPKEIKALNPAAQIVVMLRNPVDMMYALHHQYVWCAIDDIADFGVALKADEDCKLGRSTELQDRRRPWMGYREAARFPQQLRRYFDVFGRQNVHVIIYDDFSKDTATAYREVLCYLNVGTDFQPEFRVIHSSHRARNMRLHKFMLHPPKPLLKIATPRVRQFVLRSLFLRLNTVHERRRPMDPILRRELVKEFEPDIEDLSALLGRDLSSWCSTPVMV